MSALRSRLRLVVVVLTAGFASSALASDGPLQHALNAARCLRPQLERVAQQGSITVYRARCAGAGNRVVTLACDPIRCRLEDEAADEL